MVVQAAQERGQVTGGHGACWPLGEKNVTRASEARAVG
jgi:hypothetical protein